MNHDEEQLLASKREEKHQATLNDGLVAGHIRQAIKFLGGGATRVAMVHMTAALEALTTVTRAPVPAPVQGSTNLELDSPTIIVLKKMGWEFMQTGLEEWQWLKFDKDECVTSHQGSLVWADDVRDAISVAEVKN